MNAASDWVTAATVSMTLQALLDFPQKFADTWGRVYNWVIFRLSPPKMTI